MSEQEVPPGPDWLPQEVWAQIWRSRSEDGQRQVARLETKNYLATQGDVESNFGDDFAFAFGGEAGGKLADNHLLLTTTGRKSGKLYTTPLIFLHGEGDEDLVVIGSFGGLPKHPQWYKNLVVKPEGWVQIANQRWPVKTRVAHGEERARLWEQVEKYFKLWAHFQAYVEREFPVVILTRAGDKQAVETPSEPQ